MNKYISSLPELDLQILYHLDNAALMDLCLVNTTLSKICFNNPILKKRIDNYILDLNKKIKINHYINLFVDQNHIKPIILYMKDVDYHLIFSSPHNQSIRKFNN